MNLVLLLHKVRPIGKHFFQSCLSSEVIEAVEEDVEVVEFVQVRLFQVMPTSLYLLFCPFPLKKR